MLESSPLFSRTSDLTSTQANPISKETPVTTSQTTKLTGAEGAIYKTQVISTVKSLLGAGQFPMNRQKSSLSPTNPKPSTPLLSEETETVIGKEAVAKELPVVKLKELNIGGLVSLELCLGLIYGNKEGFRRCLGVCKAMGYEIDIL